MTGFFAWGAGTLLASGALMALLLAIRAPVRRWVGPGLAYGLWALPALRMILPPLPVDGVPLGGIAGMSVLAVGPRGAAALAAGSGTIPVGAVLAAVWFLGALCLLGLYAIRHLRFCARVRRDGRGLGFIGTVAVIAADVEGPLAFGVIRRFIAVPRNFEQAYDSVERDLVLAHEAAHHARGDLLANWASLFMLAAHWWNPCAWIAIRAFREDQEFAVDALVLAARRPADLPIYACALAKAAGLGALPVCNLTTRSTLKGRLMMLAQKPRSNRHLVLGGCALVLLSGAALAATAAAPGGHQAVTIAVKPDGAGGFGLIVAGKAGAPGVPLPGGMTLPTGFAKAGGCPLSRDARPYAMVIKGVGGNRTYTVMCASAAAAPVRATLAEGLASLKTMRASVAVQQSPSFPPSERFHALGAIDTSIGEVETMLGRKS